MTTLLPSLVRLTSRPELAELHSPFADVRLWLADLDGPPQHEASAWLCSTEQARAARFVFARDASRYRAAHVLLRRMLQEHCGVPAGEEFETGPHDKPHLREGRPWGFNLSHSDALALIGIGSGDGIGVDVEVLRAVEDVWPLAEQNFSTSEYLELQGTPQAQVSRAFLSGWTRKEACLKAVGSGLSIAPASFTVGLAAEPKVLRLKAESGFVGVSLHTVQAGANTLAAVARTMRLSTDHEFP